MKSRFAYAGSPGNHYKFYVCSWTGEGRRVAYEYMLATMRAFGFQPSHLAVDALGIGRGYGAFRDKDRRLKRISWDSVWGLTLDANIEAAVDCPERSACHLHVSFVKKFLSISWIPSASVGEPVQGRGVLEALLRTSCSRYAFRYEAIWHPRDSGLSLFFDPTSAYERLNQVVTLWLHDVFPDNYLSAEYLDAPVGLTGLTLREWIERDPDSRGALRPYTESLVEWRPPVGRIPVIREELYRMGRVFYHPFVEEHNFERGPGWVKPIPNPLYRPDPYAAWECPDGPIPERFRADSYPETDDPQRVILHWYDAIRPRELGLR